MGASFHEDRFAGESIGWRRSLGKKQLFSWRSRKQVGETFKKGERTLEHSALRVNRFFYRAFSIVTIEFGCSSVTCSPHQQREVLEPFPLLGFGNNAAGLIDLYLPATVFRNPFYECELSDSREKGNVHAKTPRRKDAQCPISFSLSWHLDKLKVYRTI